ncbi:hypothetical protein FH690_05375 [Streptococcus suis]|nr:hypothetical protein FH690_05375 [Streptococcus suis]
MRITRGWAKSPAPLLRVRLPTPISKYRHLVFLLLLRRKRRLCFLISNFKHFTGLFKLALPNFSYACGF